MPIKILILAFVALVALPVQAEFAFEDDGKALTLRENGQPVFVYRYGMVEAPEGVDGHYRRAAYLHPLYGLDGEVLTEDFPRDHYHHRGVFWAWTDSKAGERTIETWALEGMRTRHDRWLEKIAGEDQAVIKVRNRWSFDDAPEVPVVRETVSMTVWPADAIGRSIDFLLRFENVSTEVISIEGCKVANKGYGGFGIRPDAANKPFTITTIEGVLETSASRSQTPWADMSFTVDGKEPPVGMAIFQHPGNPGYPHQGWLLRHYGFLGASWPHNTPHAMQPGDTFELRYRVYVHRGNARTGKVGEAFAEFLESMPAKGLRSAGEIQHTK